MKYLLNVTTLALEGELCTGCGMCTEVCPHGVMAMGDGRAHITDRDSCMECGACARNCPSQAITVDVGVGCAVAVISSALGLNSACCNLDDHGKPDTGCGSKRKKHSGMRCC